MVMAQGDLNASPDDEDQDDYSQLQEAGSSQLEIAVAYGRLRHDTGAAGLGSDEHSPDRANCTTTSQIMSRHWLELVHARGVAGPSQCSISALGQVQNHGMGGVFPSICRGEAASSHLVSESRWAEQLLNLCAAVIANSDIGRTQHLMWVLNDLASFTGDANQRLAAHGLKALYCRITGGKEAAATYVRPLHHQEETLGPEAVHRALVSYHERCPWHQITYTVSNQTLLEVFEGKTHLHIIDIGVIKGFQWPLFIDALVSRAGGPPASLRITTIMDQRKPTLLRNRQADADSAEFMSRLVTFARSLGLHLDLKTLMVGPVDSITQEDLKLREGETLAICCQFRLHRMSNEPAEVEVGAAPQLPSSLTLPALSTRDVFLDFLFTLNPEVLIVGENDSDQSSPDFLTRFKNCVHFWWCFFESAEAGFADFPNCEDRLITENEGGMILLNNVACEKAARIERNEPQANCVERILRAGFVVRNMSEETRNAVQTLMQASSDGWDVSYTDTNIVNLRWKHQPTTFSSLWKIPFPPGEVSVSQVH